MAPAVAFSGEHINWLLVKWTMAFVGLVGVWAAWQLAWRYSGHKAPADLAALAIALSPIYWDFTHQSMAEAPLFVWVLLSLVFIDRCWAARRPTWAQVFAVGLFAGFGMLIKGHAVGLVLAPLAYCSGPRRSSVQRFYFWRLSLLFCVGFSIPFLCWAGRNHTVVATGFDGISQLRMIRAKHPVDADSPLLTFDESMAVIVRNLRHYVVYWIPEQVLPGMWATDFDWKGSGWVFLIVTLLLVATCMPGHQSLFPLHLVVLPIMLLNVQYALGGAPRFWMPVSLSLTFLLCLRLGNVLVKWHQRSQAYAAVGLALVLLVNLAGYVCQHERSPYSPSGPWQELADFFDLASRQNVEAVGVLTPNGHAFQLISGIPAPMAGPFDYVVINRRDPTQKLPAGTRCLLASYPFELHRLEKTMSLDELAPFGLGEIGKADTK